VGADAAVAQENQAARVLRAVLVPCRSEHFVAGTRGCHESVRALGNAQRAWDSVRLGETAGETSFNDPQPVFLLLLLLLLLGRIFLKNKTKMQRSMGQLSPGWGLEKPGAKTRK